VPLLGEGSSAKGTLLEHVSERAELYVILIFPKHLPQKPELFIGSSEVELSVYWGEMFEEN